MNNQNYHNWNNMQPGMNTAEAMDREVVASKTFMTQVFAWMAGALMITAIASWVAANIPALYELLYEQHGRYIQRTILGWIVTLSPIAFIAALGIGLNKFAFPVLVAIFITFSALMGLSIGHIFHFYEMGSIVATFGICAGMFSVMAVMGFITKADLSGFGRILMMGVVGISIGFFVNYFFLRSSQMDYVMCLIGVILFTGLTAYDVQKLKKIGATQQDGNSAARMALMGATTMYLDFINLFLLLLRLMGGRR